MRCALRRFQTLGQFPGGKPTVRLQQQQGGEQAVGLHKGVSSMFFSLFSIYDSICHISLFNLKW
jgi:hypothetical protein